MARNSSHGDSSSSGRGRRAAKTPAAAAAATTPAATPVSGASSSAPAKSSTDRPMAERLLSKAGTSSEYAKLKAQWAAAKALMDKEKQEQERKRRQLAASAGTGTTRAGSKASDVATAGAGAGGEAGDEDVTGQLATQSNLIQAINRRDPRVVRACEKEFGGWHAGIVGVLLWFLLIHLSGIYFFTKGFLLTRSVLDNKSTCEVLPFEGEGGDGHGIGRSWA
ncbi:mannose-ethanolamine phosphotransferase gpi13 [Ascosphaera acerosa]|nr:mannose-ethanolamine phosphotransferase gpi13 [Ascosphaera acerosa]